MDHTQAHILTALELMKADRSFAREDERNPICPGCLRRDTKDQITYSVVDQGVQYFVCAECADTFEQQQTGCRFGQSACIHFDCLEEPQRLEFQR